MVVKFPPVWGFTRTRLCALPWYLSAARMSRNTHSSPKQRAFRDITSPSARHRWTLQENYTHTHANEKHHFKPWGGCSLLQKNAPLKMFHYPLYKSEHNTMQPPLSVWAATLTVCQVLLVGNLLKQFVEGLIVLHEALWRFKWRGWEKKTKIQWC